MTLCSDVLKALKGKTLATAESCTGGGIGAAITAVSGSSAVYKGCIVSYCNEIKHKLLGVKGLKRIKDMRLLIGNGIGVSRIPMRIAAEPQIYLLNFVTE